MEVKSMVLLLLAVVAMCSAQKKCCFPDQFEIIMSQTTGYTESGKGAVGFLIAQLASDYTNKRAAGLVTSYVMGKVQNYQYIIDYNQAVEYIFYEKQRMCQKYPFPESMENCVPSNATYLGSSYYGDKKVTTDNFAYFEDEPQTKGNVTFGVTKGDCIPFGLILVGEQNEVPVLAIEGFSNYTSGIKDPSKYFTVPSYCPRSFSKESTIGNTLPGIFSF